jgi:hypothetical protein
MPNIAAFKMQNPPAIPAFFALSSQKSPTRFHEDPKNEMHPVLEAQIIDSAVHRYSITRLARANARQSQEGQDRHQAHRTPPSKSQCGEGIVAGEPSEECDGRHIMVDFRDALE